MNFTFHRLPVQKIISDTTIMNTLLAATSAREHGWFTSGMHDYLMLLTKLGLEPNHPDVAKRKRDIIIIAKHKQTGEFAGWITLKACVAPNAYEVQTYVHKQFRRQKLGTLLISRAKSRLRNKAKITTLYTCPDDRYQYQFYNSAMKSNDLVDVQVPINDFWYKTR